MTANLGNGGSAVTFGGGPQWIIIEAGGAENRGTVDGSG